MNIETYEAARKIRQQLRDLEDMLFERSAEPNRFGLSKELFNKHQVEAGIDLQEQIENLKSKFDAL